MGAGIKDQDGAIPSVKIVGTDNKLADATISDLKKNGATATKFEVLTAVTVRKYEFTIPAAGIYYFGDATKGKMYTAGLEISF